LKATDEGYVEDINGILNTGDLPNLYQLEDKATIMENMANVAKQLVSVKRKSECCRPRSKNWANRALTVMEIWLQKYTYLFRL